MSHPLSMHHLSALDLTAPQLIRAAHAAGFSHVCLFTAPWPTDDFRFPVVTAGPLLTETRAALDETGLRAFNVDPFMLWPEVDISSYKEGLEIGASLGATSATVVVGDPDHARAADNFGKLSELAKPFGIHPAVEFMMLSSVRSLDQAVKLVTAGGNVERSIAIDVLHLMRTGGTPADVARLDPAIIGNVQINDGPLTMPEDRQVFEAMQGRMLPGSGQFPLRELLAILPGNCPISAETPNDDERRKHGDAASWAKALYKATTDVIAAL